MDRACSIPGCLNTPRTGRNMCASHCHKKWRYGSPLICPRKPTVPGRFWSKVDKTGPLHPVLGRCWVWTGGKYQNGYGMFWYKGKNRGAHRIAWEINEGVDPGELAVLHHCDNPSCVRPSHLFLGTDSDNTKDMYSKVRDGAPEGETCHFAKLTESKVQKIRNQCREGLSVQVVARNFDVSRSTVYRILEGTTWKFRRRGLECPNIS